MASYFYKARDKDGKSVSGTVEAPSSSDATQLLRKKNLFIVNLKEQKQDEGTSFITARLKRVTFNDIVNFTRQLSTMVVAGLSLPESLTILEKQSTNPTFTGMLRDLVHRIESGGNLADSLSIYPNYFSPIYISIIRAGESAGTLDEVLVRMAESLESQREFRSSVKGAMIYPIIVISGMVVVIIIMMTVVVPKLTSMYTEFNMELPTPTKILMKISYFFVKFWWMVILGSIGGSALLRKWLKTPIGKLTFDTLILRIPIIGELQKKVILTDFTQTFSMLMSSGIHILEGLKTLKDSLPNVLFQNAIADISSKVEKGFPIGEAFASHSVFPPIVPQMIRVGEETGKLDDTLLKLSHYFQTESEHLVKGLTTAIEPLIMVVLGVGVGFIVIAIITPIYNLTSSFK